MPEEMQIVSQIPGIISGEDSRYEEVLNTCISLKSLFAKEEMDYYHVDCLVLYQIALKALYFMEELAKRQVCPGLYALEDFYVDPKNGWQLYLLHPERFQMGDKEQDYEWYPEDERIFPGIVYFDPDTQLLADSRLLYKILIASAKGNVRIPPRESGADYSTLFFKTLPPELKDIFLNGKPVSHGQFQTLLNDAITLERESARMVREKQTNRTIELIKEEEEAVKVDYSARDVYTMYVLLRTETGHSGRISRMLYQDMDRLELDTRLSGSKSFLAFVYGDGFVQARNFSSYPDGFRIQLPQSIRDYSSGETITIACELMKYEMRNPQHLESEFEICLIADGRLKNDQVFAHAVSSLENLKDSGCRIRFIYDPDYRCEACDKLEGLVQDQE